MKLRVAMTERCQPTRNEPCEWARDLEFKEVRRDGNLYDYWGGHEVDIDDVLETAKDYGLKLFIDFEAMTALLDDWGIDENN